MGASNTRHQRRRPSSWLPALLLLLLLFPAMMASAFLLARPTPLETARSAAAAIAGAGAGRQRAGSSLAAAAAAVMEKDSRANKAAFERLFVKIAKSSEGGGRVRGLIDRCIERSNDNDAW